MLGWYVEDLEHWLSAPQLGIGAQGQCKILGDKSSLCPQVLSFRLCLPVLPVTQQLSLPGFYSGSGLGVYCQVDLQTWEA